MMKCKYGTMDEYKDSPYEELLDLRANVMADIIAFENEKELEDNWYKQPGADLEYRLNLEFLSTLPASCLFIRCYRVPSDVISYSCNAAIAIVPSSDNTK